MLWAGPVPRCCQSLALSPLVLMFFPCEECFLRPPFFPGPHCASPQSKPQGPRAPCVLHTQPTLASAGVSGILSAGFCWLGREGWLTSARISANEGELGEGGTGLDHYVTLHHTSCSSAAVTMANFS